MHESQEIGSFRKALDDVGFLMVFNWSDWLMENEIYRNLDHEVDSKDHERRSDNP